MLRLTLGLAAAPTFAVMALVSVVSGGEALCSAAHASPLTGMVPMYGLMAVFHLTLWLRMIRQAIGPPFLSKRRQRFFLKPNP